MTTLSALRAELDAHAGDIVDGGAAPRTVAVHERVRVLRRRRRTLAVSAAAVVLAATGGGLALTLPGSPIGPADRRLVGKVAPGHLKSLGFVYTFADSDEGSGEASLDLSLSDQPRLISWAGSGDGAVTVSTGADVRTDASDFADFLLIDSGVSGEVTVTGSGRVAVAVYTLSELADGVSADGAVFRREVAGDTLLDADFSDGNQPVSLTVPMPERGLRVASVCTGAPAGTWSEVTVNGRGRSWGPCGSWDADAGTGAGGTLGMEGLPEPGQPVTITMALTDGDRGPTVTPDGVSYGLGAYRVGARVTNTRSFDVPARTEADGHLWRFVDMSLGDRGSRSVRTSLGVGPARYVVAYVSHASEQGLLRGLVDGKQVGPLMGAARLGASMGLGVVSPRSVVELRADKASAAPRISLGLAVYERVD